MHIHIITCVWKRPEISKLFFDWYTELRKALPEGDVLTMAVGGSPNDQVKHLVPEWARYVSAQNKPLGAKWSRVLDASKCVEFDYVLILGSDDFLNAEGLAWMYKQARTGIDFVGFRDLYLVDSQTKRVVYWPGYDKGSRITIGAGRLIKREVIEATNWKLWSESKLRGLDHSMSKILAPVLAARGSKIRKARMIEENVRLFDLKSAMNMNEFKRMTNVVSLRKSNFYEKHFTKELHDKIQML